METARKIFWWVVIYVVFLAIFYLFLGEILNFDRSFFLMINGLQNPVSGTILGVVTYLGSSLFWIFMIILFWLKGRRKISMQLIYVFVLDTLSMIFLKLFFLRPRPYEFFNFESFIDANLGPSFPSGHTERAFSGAFILSQHYKKYTWTFYSLSVLVALSRIYLGLHFPLDTLIGALNGIIIAMIAKSLPTDWIKKYF